MSFDKWLSDKIVYVVGHDRLVEDMFGKRALKTIVVKDARKYIQDKRLLLPDVLVFTGGEDVTPALYGQINTHSENYLDRDVEEMIWYHWAMCSPVLKIGICRGGQFLNVMNGGTMLQNISGHAGPAHLLSGIKSLKNIGVTSTHHQAIIPNQNTGVTIANAYTADMIAFSEIVWYPNTQSLCFQPHPEYNEETYKALSLTFESILGNWGVSVEKNEKKERKARPDRLVKLGPPDEDLQEMQQFAAQDFQNEGEED